MTISGSNLVKLPLIILLLLLLLKIIIILFSHKAVNVDQDHVDSFLTLKDIRGKNGTYLCSAYDGKVTAEDKVDVLVLGTELICGHEYS